jgi:transcriptional regulator with XRE-family HTH domain
MAAVAATFRPALSREDFCAWIELRRSARESLASIGRSLGVSQPAISQWLTGATTPSRTVLLFAAHLAQAPVDLADGLPVGPGDAGS